MSTAPLLEMFRDTAIKCHIGFKHEGPWEECKWIECEDRRKLIGHATSPPSDTEQLVRLRRLAREARDVLALLVPYGKIHTVEGVRYPDGSHSEAVDRGERVLNQLREALQVKAEPRKEHP